VAHGRQPGFLPLTVPPVRLQRSRLNSTRRNHGSEDMQARTKNAAAAPGSKRWETSALDTTNVRNYKRQALIREASFAFGRQGYADTSLEEIAKKLSLSKAALYYYVSSKEELLYECYMLALDLGDQALGRAVSEGKNGLQKVVIFIQSYIELLTAELDVAAILLDYQHLTADMKENIRRRRKDHDKALRSMIEEGIRDGSCRECDPKLAVTWFMGAINSISRWFKADGELDGHALATAYVDFAVRGFGKAAPSRKRPAARKPA
jgi:TetR/AcrR family transcriptional regulator